MVILFYLSYIIVNNINTVNSVNKSLDKINNVCYTIFIILSKVKNPLSMVLVTKYKDPSLRLE